MRSVMLTGLSLLIVLGSALFNPSYGLDKTQTGFYYPTGTSSLGNYADWLEEPPPNGNYTPGKYHIGKDIAASLESNVYAIADGDVIWKTEGGWGEGNCALLIRHELQGGGYFVAVYGHIRTSLDVGDPVTAGVSFATIGPWDPTHLHFGIHPGYDWFDQPYGRMDMPLNPPHNGFVDPIDYIQTHTPNTFSATYVSQTPTHPTGIIPADINETKTITFTFHNSGSASWTYDGNSPNYVELASVNSSFTGHETSTLLSPASNTIGPPPQVVNPNTNVTWSFNVTMPPDPGPETLRVMIYHPDQSEFISPMYIDVHFNVVDPDPSVDPYSDLAVLYDYGSCQTQAHVFTSTGSTFNNWTTWKQQNEFCISLVKYAVQGDYDGDGDDDIAMVYDYGSNNVAIHCFISTGGGFAYEPYWWSASLDLSTVKAFVSGDYDGDGDDDLAFARDWGSCNTKIHTILSNANGAFVYQGDAGWWYAPGWYCMSAVHGLVSGDLDNNGKDDIAMSYRYGTTETAFHCFLSTGSAFTYSPNWWHVTYFSLDAVPFPWFGGHNERIELCYYPEELRCLQYRIDGSMTGSSSWRRCA